MMYRRPIVRPGAALLKALYDECRGDLAQMHFRHQCAQADLVRQLDEVRAELDQVRAAFDELRSISFVRQRAEQELASLHR
jgi:hypothetical protein